MSHNEYDLAEAFQRIENELIASMIQGGRDQGRLQLVHVAGGTAESPGKVQAEEPEEVPKTV